MPRARKPKRKSRYGLDKKTKTADVVRLAGRGLPWRTIAEKVGLPAKTAHDWHREFWEEEHALFHDDVDRIRVEQTTILQRAQRVAERAMYDCITMQEAEEGGQKVEKVILSDPETFAKCGALVAKFSERIAMMNGANKPLKIDMEGGGLPPDVFAQLAEARMKRANAKPV